MSELGSFPTYDEFLEYRAVIVQAIAAAWQDPAFLEQLIEHPKAALLERFGYHYPLNLALKVNPDSASWSPPTNGGWITKQNNALELMLPPAPAQQDQFAIALAAYNAKHIDILECGE
ncbi:BMA_0021/BMA_0022 family TOMM bacteriocin [Paraburkholderia sp. ZP32-5]|uniref:BMA_0021/BMA_0022 family TOMM bacteriocin n=1 Tax=Paraburkholderia sp. ZP32-5 TaxID=2883245 RepID=UPI001F3FB991|nr:BMA_0021/BMA_0022 family TOMM bacteriocin [Paraburkholderia sp. ZP32-5]